MAFSRSSSRSSCLLRPTGFGCCCCLPACTWPGLAVEAALHLKISEETLSAFLLCVDPRGLALSLGGALTTSPNFTSSGSKGAERLHQLFVNPAIPHYAVFIVYTAYLGDQRSPLAQPCLSVSHPHRRFPSCSLISLVSSLSST